MTTGSSNAVSITVALPLAPAQAAEMCNLADAGDGFANLHEVLSMDSVSRYFESFAPQQTPRNNAVPSPHSARAMELPSGRHTARGESKRSSR